ncbi:tyrosine-type recombinase/integrase [Prosthecomicrobium sp. N25]|uniref:tyrosine-type recombinase/integrase n=1 Tax=Prosthecomicrobium sp. N25 TaxID=3129254 RepID=UPI0030783BE1
MSLRLVRRKKSPYWYLRGSVRGKSIDESTGTADREAADAIRIQREKEILDETIYGRRSVATFTDAVVSYLEHGGERRFLAPLLDHFTGTKLARIDQAAIDKAARKLYPGAAPATVNRQVYTPMSAILKNAAERGMADYRPIKRPRQPKGVIRWLTPDGAERLIAACAPHLRPIVVFLLYTGARVSEALYLDWRHVDLSRRHVEFLDTKNGESRGVPLHPRVVAELANLPRFEWTDRVFLNNRGQPFAEKTEDGQGGGQIKTGFTAACRRAGIKNLRPHDLRHTWATWHYQRNRDLTALMALGGWKSEAMVMRYAHTNSEHHAPSIEALPWDNFGNRDNIEAEKRIGTGS